MASAPSPIQVGSLVPNVWFDIFGRIIPGAYLLLGIFSFTWSSVPAVCVREYLEKYPVTGLPIAFLVFIGATYMIGWLLGAASYWLVEFPSSGVRRIWARIRERSLVPSRIEQIVEQSCGPEWSKNLREENKKRKARDHCTYLIWHTDPTLAVIFGRWDAESLGARSTVIASLLLLYLAKGRSYPVTCSLWAVAATALVAYLYHSKRALNARFDMALALFGSQYAHANPSVTPPPNCTHLV